MPPICSFGSSCDRGIYTISYNLYLIRKIHEEGSSKGLLYSSGAWYKSRSFDGASCYWNIFQQLREHTENRHFCFLRLYCTCAHP
ncbi:MAG: hypothetical protein PWR29_1093 [Methanolobus sp.]|nr:hypothetical protein [Methanolobus sp.]